MKGAVKFLPSIVTLVLAGLVFLSCNSRYKGASFISQLDEADAYIELGEVKEALSVLKEAEENALTSTSVLSIYKRYIKLGELEKAQKILSGAQKNFEGNDLKAIYVKYLLEKGDYDLALEESRSLSGTEYASFYAESLFECCQKRGVNALSVFEPLKVKKNKVDLSPILKKSGKKISQQITSEEFESGVFYQDLRFIPVYQDCYQSTKDGSWLINGAVLHMANGKYDSAIMLAPGTVSTQKESLFWGTVFYDACRFDESLFYLTQLPLTGKNAVLAADGFYIAGNEAESENARKIFMSECGVEFDEDGKFVSAENAISNPNVVEFLPLVYLNSGRYHHLQEDKITEYKMLDTVTEQFKDFVPGLSSFGQFAMDSTKWPKPEKIWDELRMAGLKTLGMEDYDALPKITVQDAIDKIKNASVSPELNVLKAKLENSIDSISSDEKRYASLWEFLERNAVDGKYPSEVARYAVQGMIKYGHVEDSRNLFNNYLLKNYGTPGVEFVASENCGNLSLWECETAAWFASVEGRISDAKTLYEYIIQKFSSRRPEFASVAENGSVVNSLINLGVILDGLNDSHGALELFNQAMSRTVDDLKKSEILYRIALTSNSIGDRKTAVRSLQYSLALNPRDYKAKILLKKFDE